MISVTYFRLSSQCSEIDGKSSVYDPLRQDRQKNISNSSLWRGDRQTYLVFFRPANPGTKRCRIWHICQDKLSPAWKMWRGMEMKWREARLECLEGTHPSHVRVPLRLYWIVTFHHSLTAQGHNAATCPPISFQRHGFKELATDKQPIAARKRANVKLVRPHPRPDRQHETETQHKTFMAGNYLKTTARGCGHYQAIVSSWLPPYCDA